MTNKRYMDFILYSVIIFLLFLVAPKCVILIREYQYRFKACDPNIIISTLEENHSINFSDNIKDVKAANTIPSEGSIDFIIKFQVEPNEARLFLKSFIKKELPQENYLHMLDSYVPELDARKQKIWPNLPEWFTRDISQGKTARAANFDVYIDISNKNNLTIYVKGFYSSQKEKRTQDQNFEGVKK